MDSLGVVHSLTNEKKLALLTIDVTATIGYTIPSNIQYIYG